MCGAIAIRATRRTETGGTVTPSTRSLAVMAVLQALNGLNAGQLFPIAGKRAVLGRHPDCDIVLDIGAVSRQHAQILLVENDFYVEDLESRNGTFVNGEPIKGRQRLVENDQVRVCDLLFSFHFDSPSSYSP